VPQAEVLRYASDLRSLSQGRGTFEVKFAYYDVVPQHIAQKIVEESKVTEGTKA
jgi:elongation factor G